MQRIEFIGNLTKDPVGSITSTGKKATRFNVAVDRWQHGENQTKSTDYFTCSVYGRTAENCETWLRKGSKVYISGELRPKILTTDAKDPYLLLDVFCQEVQFLSKKPDNNTALDDLCYKEPEPIDPYSDITPDEIPF